MLEVKAVMTGLFYVLGIPATLLGIIENYGTWKATVLFILSAILIVVKILYFVIDKDQKRRERDMDLEQKRHELDKIKQNL
jgi:membrane protein implicated in regulation of membrane protease activity